MATITYADNSAIRCNESDKRNWRCTALTGADGLPVRDDWTLHDDAGGNLARIYKIVGGPQHGRWAWFVQVDPEGHQFNGGTGSGETGREARDDSDRWRPPITRLWRPPIPE